MFFCVPVEGKKMAVQIDSDPRRVYEMKILKLNFLSG